MSSNNSWGYLRIFLSAVRKKYSFTKRQMEAIEKLMSDVCDKSPSRQMGGSGFADTFFSGASRLICSEQWCGNELCKHHSNWSLYGCMREKIPASCKEWRSYRKKWRSYPDKEECRTCDHFKPDHTDNKHRCYCRKKVLPDNCPKKP